ncbi:MAG TPA: polyprenyl synthetase family protein [Terracidiphilus sp.]|nr:polyprenyl synthetase family protein [Terracidiphilus sp.]
MGIKGSERNSPLDCAVRELLSSSGSMVRPQIAFELAMSYGLPLQPATDLAVAIEYFHTASLVFDDLPCMDDASTRRGGPCLHRQHGEATAILAALALINRAYALVWSALDTCPAVCRRATLDYLEDQLGARGLLQGQSLDLHYHASARTVRSAEHAARMKTVPLIALALVLPAMALAAPAREVQLLRRASACWGMAYQLLDDLKDVLHSAEEAGKTTARDAELERPNVALLLGVSAAVDRLSRWICGGDAALEELVVRNPKLAFLRRFRGQLKAEFDRVMERAGAIPIDCKR